MSTAVLLKTACGRKTTTVDMYDLELNPYGASCCEECESLINWYEKGLPVSKLAGNVSANSTTMRGN